ncbi:DNA cytosine methyltransferase [Candidatus Omnitrophota bacterium]
MKKGKNKPTAIDLFAGAGGITEGFKWAGFDVLASLEWDHDACETHRANHPDTAVIEGDITKASTKAALTKAVNGREVDIIVGGPPCQGFSLVGTRLGTNKKLGSFIDDPRNVLYKEFIKIVKKHNPKIFIMENVPGLFSYKKGLVREQIIRDFRRIGYDVNVDVLNAADYGVPQLRKRVIFMGNRMDISNRYPKKTHYNPNEGNKNRTGYTTPEFFEGELEDCRGKSPCKNLSEAISDLPFLRAGEGVNERVDYASQDAGNYQQLMRGPSQFIEGYNENIKRGHDNLGGVFNHQCRNHNDFDIRRYEALPEGGIFVDLPHELRNGEMPEHFKDKYRKLHSQKPSYTIVAHLYKDGNAFVHPDKKQGRTLTVREAARIQSFPDDFFFCKSRTSQFKQVGNAVPPLLAYHIALSIKDMLREGGQAVE